MKKLFTISLLILTSLWHPISAQKNNIVKINLSPIAFGHCSLQYEYVLNGNQSIAVGFSYAPKVYLPFKSTLLDAFGDDEQIRDAIESTKFSKITITPEYRFYLGSKGAPSGFYVAPFLRYVNMSTSQIYRFTTKKGVVHRPDITTKFSGLGIGSMIGVQWELGNSLTLDWWIVGPFIGTMKGSSSGTDNMSDMDQQDKDKLKTDIEDFDIPLWKKEATIGDGTIDVKLNGTLYGIRAMGLCLGVRF